MSLLRAAAAWLLLSPSISAAAVLHVSAKGLAINSCDGTIQARRSCPAVSCEVRVFPLSSARDVSLPSGRWDVTLQSSRCWAPAVSVETHDALFSVWRKAELTGAISAADRNQGRLRVEFRLGAAADAMLPATISTDCTVEGMQWRCPAPATTFQLRLALDRRAPHYVPVVTLAADEKKNLGTVLFAPGASVAGVVMPRDRRNNAVIELAPESQPRSPRRVVLNDASEGLFQFTGVPPGTYRLAITRPGWLPAELKPIRVETEREFFVPKPVELERAAVVDLFITPPLAAAGQPWRIKLERSGAGGSSTPIAEVAASPAGGWRNDALHAGIYDISILDPAGAVFLRKRIEAIPDAVPQFLTISKIQVRGVVRVGKRPFESRIIFIDDDGSRITLNTDSRGRFDGILPHDGDWQVQVRNPAETFYIKESSVIVKRSSAEAVAEADITLPGGQARGRVKNDAGEPVEADVLVFRSGKVIADGASRLPDGAFEVNGLDPGSVTLQAISRGAESETVPYLAVEDAPLSAELVLRKIVEIKCRLVSPDGEPLAGALVRYTAGTMLRGRQEQSGPAGELLLRVPANTSRILAAIAVPDFPSAVVVIDGQRTGTQQIVVAKSAALLHVIHAPDAPWPTITLDRRLFLPVTALLPLGPRGIIGLVPGGLDIRIAPGAYAICDGARPDSVCQPATLVAGETLTVHANEGTSK